MAFKKVNGGFRFGAGDSVQMLPLSGVRVNATANAAGTAEAALPAGCAGNVVVVRATDAIAIRFGATGMGAAAIDADSILFPAGEAPVPVPSTATHFRCIRVGSADVAVQLETVQMMSES